MENLHKLIKTIISSNKSPKFIVSIIGLIIIMTISFGSTQVLTKSPYTIVSYSILSTIAIFATLWIISIHKKS